jgi:hypothetical protein
MVADVATETFTRMAQQRKDLADLDEKFALLMQVLEATGGTKASEPPAPGT